MTLFYNKTIEEADDVVFKKYSNLVPRVPLVIYNFFEKKNHMITYVHHYIILRIHNEWLLEACLNIVFVMVKRLNGVHKRVINKIRGRLKRESDFFNHEYDYKFNGNTRCPVTN